MERASAAKLINMKERLILKFGHLATERDLLRATPDIIMNMARIKTILRERYNYIVNY